MTNPLEIPEINTWSFEHLGEILVGEMEVSRIFGFCKFLVGEFGLNGMPPFLLLQFLLNHFCFGGVGLDFYLVAVCSHYLQGWSIWLVKFA